jgi:hypothetical protein
VSPAQELMFALWARRPFLAREGARNPACQRNGMALAKGRRWRPRPAALASAARWRAAGACYRMGGKAGEVVFVDGPQDVNDFSICPCEQQGWRADQCVMRSGKAEDAMGAAGMTGDAVRLIRGVLAAMQAQLKSRLTLARLRREVKSAEYDQQALGGNGIGDDDADQRSPEPPRLTAKSQDTPHPKQPGS